MQMVRLDTWDEDLKKLRQIMEKARSPWPAPISCHRPRPAVVEHCLAEVLGGLVQS